MPQSAEARRAQSRQSSRSYYARNLERCRANGRTYTKKYYAEHGDERRAYAKVHSALPERRLAARGSKKKSREKHRASINAKNAAYARRRRSQEGDLLKEQGNRSNAKLREQVLTAYGRACACCGESAPAFLTIDHIRGGGTKHRASLPSKNVYAEIRREGFPKDRYRLLCWNCNCATRFGKKCPHQQGVDVLIASLEVAEIR